jgi:predicted O-methyltransferase YrrM
MTESLQELLFELENFGPNNDRVVIDRPHRMLNITRDTGEFLSVLVRAMLARRIFDLIFLDSERSEYSGWWPDVKRIMRKGGLLVVDNAISHSAEMAPFVAHVSADPDLTTCTVPIGNGEFLATWVSPLP